MRCASIESVMCAPHGAFSQEQDATKDQEISYFESENAALQVSCEAEETAGVCQSARLMLQEEIVEKEREVKFTFLHSLTQLSWKKRMESKMTKLNLPQPFHQSGKGPLHGLSGGRPEKGRKTCCRK